MFCYNFNQSVNQLCAGMAFMSSSALDWMPLLKGWFLRRPGSEQDIMMPLFEGVFEDVYQFWSINLTKKMVVLQCMVIRQVSHQGARLIKNL